MNFAFSIGTLSLILAAFFVFVLSPRESLNSPDLRAGSLAVVAAPASAHGSGEARPSAASAALNPESAAPNPVPAEVIESIVNESATEGTALYRSDAYDFTLRYPAQLKITEYAEGDGAQSIIFEDPERVYGFQIFVTPYGEETVSPERLRTDLPSGVLKSPTDVEIAGARGTHFFSKNPIMGETAEVWFIRGGYLYEVNTYAELDHWLAQILATWKFL